jgi:ubiquinone/menaquinone biosynthesis C-methylase UbiE
MESKNNMEIDSEYLELLNCNLDGQTNFNLDMLKEELIIYKLATKDWSVYDTVATLEDWSPKHFTHLNMHPMHKKLIDTVTSFPINTVCEIGAGAGTIAKYIHNVNKNIKLTCVEGSDIHLEHMKQNFSKNSHTILPNITVNANIIKGVAQEIPLPSASQDLVYTCTVLMHIPYLMAIKAIQDISRVSKKYVLHLERKDGNVVIGKQKSSLNYLKIDYRQVYEKLGFKTIKYEEFPYPECETFSCIFYFGEK